MTQLPRNRRRDAFDLRAYWRAQFVSWRDQKLTRLSIGGRQRNVVTVMIAVVGLLDNMQPDGRLRGKRDDWSLAQLAGFMCMSVNSARELMDWMEDEHALVVTRTRGDDGRLELATRQMVLPGWPVRVTVKAPKPDPTPRSVLGRGDQMQKVAVHVQRHDQVLVGTTETTENVDARKRARRDGLDNRRAGEPTATTTAPSPRTSGERRPLARLGGVAVLLVIRPLEDHPLPRKQELCGGRAWRTARERGHETQRPPRLREKRGFTSRSHRRRPPTTDGRKP